jgi:hypothetical protein
MGLPLPRVAHAGSALAVGARGVARLQVRSFPAPSVFFGLCWGARVPRGGCGTILFAQPTPPPPPSGLKSTAPFQSVFVWGLAGSTLSHGSLVPISSPSPSPCLHCAVWSGPASSWTTFYVTGLRWLLVGPCTAPACLTPWCSTCGPRARPTSTRSCPC